MDGWMDGWMKKKHFLIIVGYSLTWRWLTAQKCTFWRNWDFDTGYFPEHFPISSVLFHCIMWME